MYTQVTLLRNYYATSDPDNFCFDKHKDAQEHYEEWVKEYFDFNSEGEVDLGLCRVYPEDLLPPEHHNQSGHWKITVEFIPSGRHD